MVLTRTYAVTPNKWCGISCLIIASIFWGLHQMLKQKVSCEVIDMNSILNMDDLAI